MSWFMPWSEHIKKRSCRYLLQRYLGQFLEEKLTLDQLTIDLYNGKGIVSNVSLDAQALNELADQQSLPVWFVCGNITSISVSVPWSTIFTEPSYVEISGLNITLKPKQRAENCASMFESMWNSRSSSMQLAKECLKQDESEVDSISSTTNTVEGMESFAKAIDSILRRVKVKFTDITLRLEHIPQGSSSGVAVELKIEQMTYLDEAGMDEPDEGDNSGKYQSSAFTIKKFSLEGVSIYTDEFTLPESNTFITSVFTSAAQIQETEEIEDDVIHSRILAAKLASRQEIRLKMKESENIQGPKVSLEILLGSLTTFLSPRQLHGLICLAGGFVNPCCNNDNNLTQHQGRQKPMESRDFQIVEQDLQNLLLPSDLPATSPQRLLPNQGWTTGGDSDEEIEQFHPFRGKKSTSNMSGNMMTSSMNSSIGDSNSMISSINASSFTSSVSEFTQKCLVAGMPSSEFLSKKRKSHRVAEDETWTADTTTFSIRTSSLVVILLQDDILVCGPNKQLSEASTLQMSDIAMKFFSSLGDMISIGFGAKDFEKVQEILRKSCNKSHLRLIAAPVTIDGNERTGSNGSVIEASLTAARLELLEILPEQINQDSDLLKFLNLTSGASLALTPDLQLNFKRTEKLTTVRQPTLSRTTLTAKLQPCLIEVDISIVDRIATLLDPPCWMSFSPVTTKTKDIWKDAVDITPINDTRIDVNINSPLLSVKLRFPKPDLRPLSDMQRVPYWQRNVHTDWLLLELNNAELSTIIDSRNPSYRLELQGKNLIMYYQDGEQEKIAILNAQAEEPRLSLPNSGQGFGLLRCVLTVNPIITPNELHDPTCDPYDSEENPGSIGLDVFRNTRSREPSPFSAKKVVHESDTPHDVKGEGGESDELLIPGDKRELNEFIDLASRNTRFQLELSLPKAQLSIPSKYMYELIYNRISTDLLLWEPGRPSENYNTDNIIHLPHLHLPDLNFGLPTFEMCKSSLNIESDSDSDTDGIFYSMHETKFKQKSIQAKKQKNIVRNGQGFMTVSLSIGQGIISLTSPVRDSLGNVIPNQHGQFQLHVVEGSLFCVSNYRGDPNLAYICIQSNQAALHHSGLIPSNLEDPLLQPTIIQTNNGAIIKTGGEPIGTGSQNSLDMLTVSIRIHLDTSASIKNIRIAAAVRGGTLIHRVTTGTQSWLMQLIDMLDVLDFPVSGYTPPRVITELHLHLWDCSVDYRPLYLPIRTIITLGSFSISSNIAAATRSSSLRFIAEEGALFLSSCTPRTTYTPPDLRRDYVCVLELGLFELALRLSEDPRAPKIDLRASSTALHVRTCADSCRALIDLLIYFANDGDLTQANITPRSSCSSLHQGSTDQLYQQQSKDSSHAELVPDMMEEAMRDAGNGGSGSGETAHNIELKTSEIDTTKDLDDEFCFPGDGTGAIPKLISKISDDDEEFCILGEDPGTGIMPQSGEPEIRRLVNGPIRIVENYFAVPMGRLDPLQAPRNFPSPEIRYTLCDLNLEWHLYGGSDFSTPDSSVKRVRIDESERDITAPKIGHKPSVSFSKSNPNEIRFNSSQSPMRRPSGTSGNVLSWQARGGVARDHNVLMELQLSKVRFRHEEYPEKAEVASRQVLLIQSLEIRDRLATSSINKFLYLHSSEAQPKQAHANMVSIKAVHLRPDVNLANQQECCLRVSLLPLRLNIDQDALLFLYTFFSDLGASSGPLDDDDSCKSTPTHQAPVMSVKGVATTANITSISSSDSTPASPCKTLINENDNLIPTLDVDDNKNQAPIFFRTLLFFPDVPIRVDYQGKRVDMTHGPLAGILMGLAQLNCSELKLKRLSYRHGLLGFDKLLAYVLGEWLNDIKKNQLPSVLGGVGPMHSFVQLFQGLRDLVLLPIEQYQKDGRIVRGLQRGAHSFTSSTAMAALELTNRLVHAVQIAAETAFDMLSPGPSVRQRRILGSGMGVIQRRRRYNQPMDFREGVANAYHLVQEGIGETARTIVAVASAEHEEKGVYGAVGGVLRQIPPTVVTPILLGAEAASSVLKGARSQLAPDVRREAAQKWRSDS